MPAYRSDKSYTLIFRLSYARIRAMSEMLPESVGNEARSAS